MEIQVRIFNRQLLNTPRNFLQSPLIPYRSLSPQHHRPIHFISTASLPLSRIHSSFSPVSRTPITPNPNPRSFVLSLSSPHLLNPLIPSNYSNFSFKFHPNDGVFAWHRAPESGIIGALGAKDPVVTVVLLGWLGAKQKHLKKYVEWYNSRGINAITFVVGVGELFGFDFGERVEKRIAALEERTLRRRSKDVVDSGGGDPFNPKMKLITRYEVMRILAIS
ncbi:hypothetical protein GH714_034044 [Hevea brasiliensis]|uniref:Uncharacterized protein n=1 Tax=Hevea brasiliensis TaxID=3981 RepID=A0A6A6LPD6_HEVBR|nr:hypothetical protein GH714_034044 [Hevea brasiliensis]